MLLPVERLVDLLRLVSMLLQVGRLLSTLLRLVWLLRLVPMLLQVARLVSTLLRLVGLLQVVRGDILNNSMPVLSQRVTY
mmetsp:Transcript_159029/g.290034  ORF Transcript_159029/g.290034 Transcript_159029/m.290034 type:complete len:80 (+) Transcript_159029:629-868(+)